MLEGLASVPTLALQLKLNQLLCLPHLSQMQLVHSLSVLTITMAMIITMVLMVTVEGIIVVSMIVVALVKTMVMAVAVEASEVTMARRNSLTMTLTNTVDIVKELVTIFMSAEHMLRSKKRKRRIMVTLLVRAGVMGLLVGQSNINQALFALIFICPLM